MNAMTSNKTTWLLKREFWEHKGGFLWAPLISGAIFLLMSGMAILVGEKARIASGGQSAQVNGIDLTTLSKTLTPEQLQNLGGGLDVGVLLAGTWPFIALAFVVFFYCLGALYDERKDRSILFWKSLPLSDSHTVLSKVASAVLVAPLIATAASIVTSLGFLTLLSAYSLYHGVNPITMIWGPASPLHTSFLLLASIPMYALWAMPTVGWLLLVSAWAKAKPFLWAVAVPVFSGILVSWFDVMEMFNLNGQWYWKNVVGRLLLGSLNGSDIAYRISSDPAMKNFNPDGPAQFLELFSISNTYSALASPSLWIGVLLGAAMIYGAVHFRRTRDEG